MSLVGSGMTYIFLVSPIKVLGCWKQLSFLRMAIFGGISQVDRRAQELMLWLGPQLGAMGSRVDRGKKFGESLSSSSWL